jgi:hypothetical protein
MEWDVIRVWSTTYRQIKVMAALRGLTLGKMLAQIVEQEFEKTGLSLPVTEDNT